MQFQRDERVERRRARRRQVRRRRLAALLVIAGIGTLAAVSTTSLFRGARSAAPGAEAVVPQLPLGGTQLLPRYRIVAFYGAPGGGGLGVLGSGPITAVVDQLDQVAQDYSTPARPVQPALELVTTVAQDYPGPDGMYRSRVADAVIQDYLTAARQARAILILDIQPGRASFIDEVQHLRPFLEQSDVSLAIDPEWSMRPGQIPGRVFGSTDGATINEVSAYLDDIVRQQHLPQKLLIVHQFRDGMIRDEGAIVQRPGLAIVLNADGFGTPDEKTSKYTDLTTLPDRPPFAFSGFKLFFRQDSPLMSPYDVLALGPAPDVVVYQ